VNEKMNFNYTYFTKRISCDISECLCNVNDYCQMKLDQITPHNRKCEHYRCSPVFQLRFKNSAIFNQEVV